MKMEYTGYKDCNGKKVHVGDTIDFTWWINTPPRGLIESHKIGTIEKLQRGLAFRHKGSYRMLSALCFDSECDWEIIKTK
jgi:hypothetical protein